jgi:ABC-type phosphate/phosphonate transport system ATPase subunit
MLVATHDLDFASRLCTRFLLLEQGRIVFDEPDCQAIRTRWGME